MIVLLLTLAVLGGGGFFGYNYFSTNTSQATGYQPEALPHIRLDDNILRFTFEVLPGVYDAIVIFNREITRIDNELVRIDAISARYPDQAGIVEKEKSGWQKSREKAVKVFDKIQQKLESLYVILQVNREKGIEAITDAGPELLSSADDALNALEEMTGRLPLPETPPPGIIDGTIYKIKKKFF